MHVIFIFMCLNFLVISIDSLVTGCIILSSMKFERGVC